MFTLESIETIKSFLASDKCTNNFTFDRMLGAMTSVLSCSEFVSEYELAELVVGNLDVGFEEISEEGDIRTAWLQIFNQLTEQLVTEEFSLTRLYSISDDAIAPPEEVAQWCDGYLQGYLLTQNIWEQDFDEMLSASEFDEAENIVEECEATLNFIATFASWQDALEQNKEPEKLQFHVLQIFETISESMMVTHKLSIMLEDLKLNSDDESVETYERETPKVSRNDPCPCGSGKKYKKCCLN